MHAPIARRALGLALLCGLFFLASEVRAERRVFQHPTVGGEPLDWCLETGRACGEPAARAWCRARGYERERGFRIVLADAHSVTRTLGDRRRCTGRHCHGFEYIRCSRRGHGRLDRPGGTRARELRRHPWGFGSRRRGD